MARIVDAPPPNRRKTNLPYSEWMCGKWVELRRGEDFAKHPKDLANAFNAYCRRNGIVGKAVTRRDGSQGGMLCLVYVWADPDRPLDLGFPEEVTAI